MPGSLAQRGVREMAEAEPSHEELLAVALVNASISVVEHGTRRPSQSRNASGLCCRAPSNAVGDSRSVSSWTEIRPLRSTTTRSATPTSSFGTDFQQHESSGRRRELSEPDSRSDRNDSGSFSRNNDSEASTAPASLADWGALFGLI
jgi:hypothetical protein